MNYPKYKYSYRKIKCYDRKVYINSVATYQYIPERNVYRLIKQTCSLNEDYNNRHRCLGHTKFLGDCYIINPQPTEVPPDSLEFEPQSRLID